MHLSLFTTFCPPNILVFPPNIFDKSTSVISLALLSRLLSFMQMYVSTIMIADHRLSTLHYYSPCLWTWTGVKPNLELLASAFPHPLIIHLPCIVSWLLL